MNLQVEISMLAKHNLELLNKINYKNIITTIQRSNEYVDKTYY